MAKGRTAAEEQVAGLLRTAREALGLSVAFLSRLDGETQHLEVVESRVPLLRDGQRVRQETSFCQAILDGRLPAVIPDVRAFPEAMALPAARMPRLRSYVSAPVVLSDGTLYGTFCATGLTADKGLGQRDRALMEVLASAAAMIIEPDVVARARTAEIEARLRPLLATGGPAVVLQPVVDLATGARSGAEALSRFPAGWGRAPDVVFAEAHDVGLGDRLELLALERAAEHLAAVDGYVALNVSPGTLLTPACGALLARLPAARVLLELSEHDPVTDYDALHAALTPLRAAGMRLAIDDVGAGFSSLRHIVLCRPDVIKLDRTIVDGVAADPVLTALVGALVTFAHGNGIAVVAEGVETAQDAAALRALAVDHGQGWFFGRPGPAAALAPTGAVVPAQRTPALPAALPGEPAPELPAERLSA